MVTNKILGMQIKLYLLASILGVIAGVTAIVFRLLIRAFSLFFVLFPTYLGPIGWIIAPVAGGGIVGVIVQKYAPEAKGHGVPELIDSYVLRGGKIRARVPFFKSLASAIAIGSGGSCGREGPIAQIGGGVGSFFGTRFGLTKSMTKTLLVCGTSAGIAATFNAPLGGTLFGIEIIAGGLAGFSIIPIILSSVIATAVANAVLGSQPSFQAPVFVVSNYIELVFYLLLGLLFGLVSVAWIRGFYLIEDIIEWIRTSRYFLPSIGGFLVGALALFTIYLEISFGYQGAFKPEEPYFPAIMGVGYSFIDTVFQNGISFLGLLLVFGILKFLATSITLGSGSSGGVFAPTLFMGAAFGGTFGILLSVLFPPIVINPMAYALVGMAALFAGAGRAPITCIVMIMEMTGDYKMILPLMIAVATSYIVSSVLEEESIYTLKISRRGINVKRGLYISALRETIAKQIMTKKPTTLSPTMTVTEVLKVVDKTHHTKFPVVDKDGKIVGTLITESLFGPTGEHDKNACVCDLMMTDFLRIHPDWSMERVLHEMLLRDEGHGVVIDPKNPSKMLGFLTKADVLRAYEISILKLREEGEDVQGIDATDIPIS